MKTLLLFILLISGALHAHPLHMFAGAGFNLTSYNPRNSGTLLGAGLNFKADLGYFYNPNWAFEFSSQVKFNAPGEYFIWDTLLTVGLRHHFGGSGYYGRVFYGRSPTVVYLDDAPEVTRETNASRIQYDGPVYGLGGGKLFKTESGLEWFIESALSYQHLDRETGIRNDGNVPVEVFRNRPTTPVHVFSLYAIIGMRVF